MYVILTNDKRIPLDVVDFEYETYTPEEFIAKEEFTETEFYVDIACLPEKLYEAFKQYESQIDVVYYKWSDVDTKLNFDMTDEVIVYQVNKPTPVEEIVEKEPPKEEPKEVPSISKPLSQTVETQIERDIESSVDRTPEQKKQDEEEVKEYKQEIEPQLTIDDSLDFVVDNISATNKGIDSESMTSILSFDDDVVGEKKQTPAKTIAFGSSKGGSGKTTTCAMAVKNYAMTHPTERIAVADFDIIDGQLGALIGSISPTLAGFYKQYKLGNTDFSTLYNYKVKSDGFGANVDFYLAMPIALDEVINDDKFWNTVFTELIMHYDVVFFDTGIDYLNIAPITQIYKIVDRLILTTNTSVPSVKSTMKQLQALNGSRKNLRFKKSDEILDKTRLVITRATKNKDLLKYIVNLFKPLVKVGAIFGTMEDMIDRVSWYHDWNVIKNNESLCKYLTTLCDLSK